jgi:NADP-dependent 3-hydroxy acid dehydrogenase YdfG
MSSVNQRTVLVTGSSQGLGKEIVDTFAEEGWQVWAGTRDISRIGGHRSNVHPVELDITSQSSIDQCIKTIASNGSRLDALVNNAGIGTCLPLIDTDENRMHEVFDVNVLGMLRMCKATIPLLVKTHGTIVNIGSIAGQHGACFLAGYCGTKWAVRGCSESLFFELDPIDVHVKVIEPGKINNTEFFNAMNKDQQHTNVNPLFASAHARFIKRMNHQNGCSLSQVANCVYRAATDTSKRIYYCTGVTFLMHTMLLLRKISPSAFRHVLQRYYQE